MYLSFSRLITTFNIQAFEIDCCVISFSQRSIFDFSNFSFRWWSFAVLGLFTSHTLRGSSKNHNTGSIEKRFELLINAEHVHSWPTTLHSLSSEDTVALWGKSPIKGRPNCKLKESGAAGMQCNMLANKYLRLTPELTGPPIRTCTYIYPTSQR